MTVLARTTLLLLASNAFLQVPADRIGYTAMSLPQIKILAVYFVFRSA